MKVLIFSDRDPIKFQSKRQLLWLVEFFNTNINNVSVNFAESTDYDEEEYDCILIHGYDFKNIKVIKKRNKKSKLLLINPGLITEIRELNILSKKGLKAFVQKKHIEKNIDGIIVRSKPWKDIVEKNIDVPVYQWIDFEEKVYDVSKKGIKKSPTIIGYHGNPYHIENSFKYCLSEALEMLNKRCEFEFHILTNEVSSLKNIITGSFSIKFFEYANVDFENVINNFDIGVTPTMTSRESIEETSVLIRNANRTISLLARGIPSITSPLPQSVIDLENNIHTIYAITAKEWFDSFIKLIEDENFYNTIRDSGYKLVKNKFLVDTAGEELTKIIESVLNEK